MVEAHATALNCTSTFFGIHIVRQISVRRFDLEGLRQSQIAKNYYL